MQLDPGVTCQELQSEIGQIQTSTAFIYIFLCANITAKTEQTYYVLEMSLLILSPAPFLLCIGFPWLGRLH